MKILHSWNSAQSFTDAHSGAITVGNFDGVHMGHEQVLAEVRGHALDVKGPAVAVTFEPHPRAILFPDEKPRRLCHLHERLELLKRAGMDAVMLLHFNREMATWTPETFIRKLHAAFRFKHMHVGYDFAFGHARSGDADSLRQIGEGLQFTVSEAAAFEMHGAVVSSSRIRSSIEAADFKLTEELLGRPYSMSGHVGKGDQRGRELGFPTANLDVKELAHPPVGVYAVLAECQGKIWDAAAYFGYRPTFRGRTLVLETHIFDAHPDLYKKRLKVHFIERVREDRAFKSPEALASQIAKDCAIAREILSQRDKD